MQLVNSAGVMPTTRVDSALDKLTLSFWPRPRNNVSVMCTSATMPTILHELPIGVEIIGRRLEEEKVLEGMKSIETLLKCKGITYMHMSA